ncbi:MAG TPA: tRNA (adenosine(37)-N6)-threonylcarbamoyltransferase complex transferase subunit TsaD [Patescibacteria group bacterium]|jgi:N6-L-threonylcarbamoyladenine synthase|nr:tRNA (adenosine(37)-N6)-threonylcarbamoyltransferase complex transferase subunit TsaD [Patescibacteria group bacterium]
MKQQNPLILGIETSCDETGLGLYRKDEGLIDHILFSQIAIHKHFGGVIPELASRMQLEKISLLFDELFREKSHNFSDVDVIAITNQPGLPGSLLVGLGFGKTIAWATGKKIIGINHLEGHIFSSCIEHTIPFPHLCLTASGGHTSLYLVTDFGKYSMLGNTKDDAAGEAFDKVAKLMHMPYPGGPIIEKYAEKAAFQDFFNYPRSMAHSLDFSFSGLKTAVLYHLIKAQAYDRHEKKFLRADDEQFKEQVASSLLVCIGDIFSQKIALALTLYPDIKAVTFVGGCAANKYLKRILSTFCNAHDLPFYAPSPVYCTDNGAMIAFVGHYKAEQNLFDTVDLDITR